MGMDGNDDSWGYHSEDGDFFPRIPEVDGMKVESNPYQSGDVVGCLVDPVTRTAFFTLNQNLLSTSSSLPLSTCPTYGSS